MTGRILEGVRTTVGCALAVLSFLALASCSSGAKKTPEGDGPLTWCGQTILAKGGEFGRTQLDPSPAGSTGITSVLPPRVAPSERIAGYSNLVIISQDCSHGAIVEVTGTSRDVRLVGVAYDPSKHGITGLLLGRTTGVVASVRVTAFEAGKEVGQTSFSF